MTIQGLTEGRIVHYVLANGEHRPAVVVRVWRDLQEIHPGYSNLIVFRDGYNDDAVLCHRASDTVPHTGCSAGGHQHPAGYPTAFWATSVIFSEENKHHTWHWPEKE